jgi:hypothetical protein
MIKLGYAALRSVRTREGHRRTGFLPAVSKAAMKEMGRTIRGWRLERVLWIMGRGRVAKF